MLYTKSIQDQKELSDGIRVSIMRKPCGEFDLWIPSLSPSQKLLDDYHTKKINWDEYECKFLLEMNNNLDATKMMKLLLEISTFSLVTILCWEETPEKCHRRLIAKLMCTINNKAIINLK